MLVTNPLVWMATVRNVHTSALIAWLTRATYIAKNAKETTFLPGGPVDMSIVCIASPSEASVHFARRHTTT